VPHPRGFLLSHPTRLVVFHRSTKESARNNRREERLKHEHRAFQETSGSILRTADTGPEQWHPRRPGVAFPEEIGTMPRYIPSSFHSRYRLAPPPRNGSSIVASTCRATLEDTHLPHRGQTATEQPEQTALRPPA